MTTTVKKSANKLTGGKFFELVATKVGLKKTVVRDVIYAITEVSVDVLKKSKEVRIPHLGRITVKDIPSKKYPAGEYPNPFKKGPDGRPLVEYREARVRPAKRKLKFSFAGQVKKPLMPAK